MTKVDTNVSDYLSDTCAAAPLSDGETRHLVLSTHYGHAYARRWARNQLVKHNMRLVASRAKRFRWSGIPYRDLMQVGVFGAMRAIDLYKQQKAKLSTYMTLWIDAEIQRYVDAQSTTIRQPAKRRRDLVAVDQAERQLSQDLGRTPTPEEIAEEANIDQAEIAWLTNTNSTLSLEQVVGTDPNDTVLMELLCGELDIVEAETEVADLWEVVLQRIDEVSELTDDDRVPLIFERHYLRGLSCTEVGDELGVSRQRVEQIKSKALALLRWLCADDDLRETWQARDCRLHNEAPGFVIRTGMALGTESHR